MNATNIYANDFLDILFDGRNKDYGAYDLRRSQDRRVRNAIIGTASIALVVIGGYVLSNRLMAADMNTRKDIIPITTVLKQLDPPLEERPVTPPPPSRPSTPPPANSSIAFTTPTITDQEIVENEVPKLDSIGTKTVGVTNTIGDVNGIDAPSFEGNGGGTDVVEAPKAVDHTGVFTFVEKMPSFPGGEAALASFLQNNMHYPRMAAENDIEGRINVTFVVDWEGNITGIKTTGNHIGAGLEEEAMRVVKLMPKWKPGRQNGQAVNVQFNLPVGFHLAH
ncbi:protein TonB [Chitinophaga sp. CF118]|uniref:energy transducer TonB n=1 Tax=Chitinophaga sp. CF118 TaxID=1884367 RepID=UPI0008E3B450|nr:energy transducer TonB [Chitinophaga sp. CF118]SFE77667.1 protein TonB [Chitinophaga sp. CF118]